jgi:anti-sigma factor RsiW
MANEREVAGVRCGEVLAELSDYLDGELVADRRRQIEAHLTGCDWCERFGGLLAGSIGVLRRELGAASGEPPETEDAEAFARLRERLRQAR